MACLEILSPPCPVVYLFHAIRMLVSLLRSCWSCATRQIPVAKCSNRRNRLKPIETATWCDWKVDMMLTCWHGLQKHRFPNPSAGTILGMQWCALDSTHASDICSCIVLECAPAVRTLLLVFQVSPHRPVLEDQTSWTDLARWQGSDGQLIDSLSLHRLHRRQVAQVHRTAELLEALDVMCVWFGICQHFRDPPMQCRLQFIYI